MFYSNNYVIFTYILLKFDSKRIYLADTFVLSFRTKFGVDIFQQVHGSSQHSVDIGMHMFNHLVCGNTKGLTHSQLNVNCNHDHICDPGVTVFVHLSD